jgi:hypothetical protein
VDPAEAAEACSHALVAVEAEQLVLQLVVVGSWWPLSQFPSAAAAKKEAAAASEGISPLSTCCTTV